MQNETTSPTPRRNRPVRRKHALLSSDPAQAMQEMMSTIDDMRAVYLEETKALEASDADGFFVIQDKKMKTARRYQKSMIEILERKDELRSVDPSLKGRLEEIYSAFSRDAEANRKALRRMQMTVNRLKETISKATRDAVTKKNALNYTERGALRNDGKSVLSTGVSETA